MGILLPDVRPAVKRRGAYWGNRKINLCLIMIVRDEARVIRRCLESVKQHIDSFCIVDTGSKDNTVEIIQDVLSDIPGEIHHRPWVDFGHNRTELIKIAKKIEGPEYFLTIDADEVLEGEIDLPTGAFAYRIRLDCEGKISNRVLIFAADQEWEYRGRVHEMLWPHYNGWPLVEGLIVRSFGDGGRHEKPFWAVEDVVAAYNDYLETCSPFKLFNIADMLTNMGILDQAVFLWDKCTRYCEWDEQNWYAYYMLAEIKRKQSGSVFSIDVVNAYKTAMSMRNTRTEPCYALASYLEEHGFDTIANQIRAMAKEVKNTDDILYVDPSCYPAMGNFA